MLKPLLTEVGRMALMFSKISFAIIAVVALSFILCYGAHDAVAKSPQAGDGVRRVTPEEVRDLLKAGKAVLVDVRGTAAYKAGHIKGALDIAVGDIAQRAGELPKNKMILTYCS